MVSCAIGFKRQNAGYPSAVILTGKINPAASEPAAKPLAEPTDVANTPPPVELPESWVGSPLALALAKEAIGRQRQVAESWYTVIGDRKTNRMTTGFAVDNMPSAPERTQVTLKWKQKTTGRVRLEVLCMSLHFFAEGDKMLTYNVLTEQELRKQQVSQSTIPEP